MALTIIMMIIVAGGVLPHIGLPHRGGLHHRRRHLFHHHHHHDQSYGEDEGARAAAGIERERMMIDAWPLAWPFAGRRAVTGR